MAQVLCVGSYCHLERSRSCLVEMRTGSIPGVLPSPRHCSPLFSFFPPFNRLNARSPPTPQQAS